MKEERKRPLTRGQNQRKCYIFGLSRSLVSSLSRTTAPGPVRIICYLLRLVTNDYYVGLEVISLSSSWLHLSYLLLRSQKKNKEKCRQPLEFSFGRENSTFGCRGIHSKGAHLSYFLGAPFAETSGLGWIPPVSLLFGLVLRPKLTRDRYQQLFLRIIAGGIRTTNNSWS